MNSIKYLNKKMKSMALWGDFYLEGIRRDELNYDMFRRYSGYMTLSDMGINGARLNINPHS